MSITLADLVRDIGGWPIDINAIAWILERADKVLPQGRDTRAPLTKAQIAALTAE